MQHIKRLRYNDNGDGGVTICDRVHNGRNFQRHHDKSKNKRRFNKTRGYLRWSHFKPVAITFSESYSKPFYTAMNKWAEMIADTMKQGIYRVKLLEILPEHLVFPDEVYFPEHVLNEFIQRVKNQGVFGEDVMAEVMNKLEGSDPVVLVERANKIDQTRAAIQIVDAEIVGDALYGTVRLLKKVSAEEEACFSKHCSSTDAVEHLALRCTINTDASQKPRNTALSIITFDLRSNAFS